MVPHDHDRSPNDSVIIRTERRDGESRVEAILRALAVSKGVPPADLEPLYDYVDPDAVDALLHHGTRRDAEVGIEFAVDGYRVVVSQDDRICVHDGRPIVDRLR